MKSLPEHLAIIMDGNGRWAAAKNRPRFYGHLKGTRVAKKIITECSRMGIKYLTLYAFSTENWLRPEKEVQFLMNILHRYLLRETANLISENIRLKVIGDMSRLPDKIRSTLISSIQKTSKCTGLELIFAINYGSKQEILMAARKIAQQALDGKITVDQIDEKTFENSMYTVDIPDPDLIVRTSGEMRLSNFLMWQSSYSELYFTSTLWPNFTVQNLEDALNSFRSRSRRFGTVEHKFEQASL